MCGIVGYIGPRSATKILVEGLARLEYRGYDSAGVAVATEGTGSPEPPGGCDDLRAAVGDGTPGHVGIAHTRWATHGEPSERNAHPHTDAEGRIAVVHNGIIENADELRAKLTADGVTLRVRHRHRGAPPPDRRGPARRARSPLEDAVREALRVVEGTYGLVVLDAEPPRGARRRPQRQPDRAGLGDGEMFVASDVAALVRHTRQVVFLADGELATVTADGVRRRAPRPAHHRRRATTPPTSSTATPTSCPRRSTSSRRRCAGCWPGGSTAASPPRASTACDSTRAISAGSDGSRSSAAVRALRRQMGAGLVEELARIPADAEQASEFRYRNPLVDPDTLYVAVSQSGETIDTLAAVQELQRKGGRVVGVVNVVGSAIARHCGAGMFVHAGPEIAVASTKAFSSMATAFTLLALLLGRVRELSSAYGARLVDGLRRLPDAVEVALTVRRREAVAHRYADARSMFYLGRVRGAAVAREGAQKLKEISYVHAEAYPAAELKHGPLALIDAAMPCVVVVPDDELLAKNICTIEQIRRPRRAGHRRDQRRPVRRARRRRPPGTPPRARARPDPARRPPAAPGLPRRRGGAVATSTSPATWPRASPWSSGAPSP